MDPDNLATAPDLEDDGLYDFFARYVRRVHSDDFIRKALLKTPKTSFVDIIGPSDIAYVISIIKNSGDVWSQDVKMVEMGVRVMGSREKKNKPLFTQGEGAHRVKEQRESKVRVYGILKVGDISRGQKQTGGRFTTMRSR